MRFAYKFCVNLVVLYVLSVVTSELESTSITTTSITPHPKELSLSHEHNDRCFNFTDDDLVCNYNYSCVYGTTLDLECRSKEMHTRCTGSYTCAFCYQLPTHFYNCPLPPSCQSFSIYKTLCSVDPNVACLGNRQFCKNVRCERVSNYKWAYAVFLSITLGGFGLDRFYLGNWQEGVGKLFSFGGLGVWTLIDVILIATGYLKPIDGSIMI